jgi:hypothetical protein
VPFVSALAAPRVTKALTAAMRWRAHRGTSPPQIYVCRLAHAPATLRKTQRHCPERWDGSQPLSLPKRPATSRALLQLYRD